MAEKKSVWNTYSETEKNALEELSSGYRDFLTKCKTERESVKEAVRLAEEKGYKDLKGILAGEDRLQTVPAIRREAQTETQRTRFFAAHRPGGGGLPW